MKKRVTKLSPILLFYLSILIGVSVWSIIPLLHPGLHTSHDIWHQVARIHHFTQAVLDGALPPQWIFQLGQGHGYPLFIFSYHFPWFFSFPLILLGMTQVAALKFTFGFFFVLAGLSMFLLARNLFKNTIVAIVVAVLYLVAPYHYLSLYVAAAIGTVIVYAVVPLTILGLHWITQKRYLHGVTLTAISVAVMVLSHLMSVALFAPVLSLYGVLLLLQNRENWKKLLTAYLVAALLSVALTAYYLLPLLVYLPATNAQNAGNGFSELYHSYFITPRQLLYSPWGFGPIVSNAKDGEISLQLGLAQWAGVLAALVLLIGSVLLRTSARQMLRKLPLQFTPNPTAVTTAIGMFLLSSALLFESSQVYWGTLTRLTSVDFPFRMLLLAVFFSSLAAGFFLTAVKNKVLLHMAAIFLIVLALYTNRNHVRVNLYWTEPVDGFIRSEVTTNTFHEYAPQGIDTALFKEEAPPHVLNAEYTVLDESTQHFSLSVKLEQPTQLILRQFDFPGIQTKLDSVTVSHTRDEKGRVVLPVTAGTHLVTVQFVPTLVSKLAIAVSFLAGASTIAIVLWKRI